MMWTSALSSGACRCLPACALPAPPAPSCATAASVRCALPLAYVSDVPDLRLPCTCPQRSAYACSQIPHNSVRPQLVEEEQEEQPGSVITWTSVDRLNMSIGLLYALCIHANDSGIKWVRPVLCIRAPVHEASHMGATLDCVRDNLHLDNMQIKRSTFNSVCSCGGLIRSYFCVRTF